MMSDPVWLPQLIRLAEHGGNWAAFIDAVYQRFDNDFVASQPRFDGKWVRCRRDPIYDGKYAGFWHCVSEGSDEDSRTPDLRRCERIGWVRPIIEHSGDPLVSVWDNQRGNDIRRLFWFREEFLVVLAERTRARDGFQYLQLVTAYCTAAEHRRKKLREERDNWKSRNG